MREPTTFVSATAARTYSRIVPAKTILVVTRGMALVHGVPVVLTHRDVCFNQDLRALVPHETLNPRFVYYGLLAARKRLQAHIDRAAHGTARVVDSAYRERLTVPSLEKQHEIVDFLDREADRMAVLELRLKRLRDLAELSARDRISGLIREVEAPAVPLRWSLHGIDQGWSPDCVSRHAEEAEWGVLKVGSVNHGVFRPEEHKALPGDLQGRPELEVGRGDLLMSRANTRGLVGSTAVVDADSPWRLMLCDKLYRLRPDPGKLRGEFLSLVLNSREVRGQIEVATSGASSSMQNISQRLVRSLRIPVPDLEIQRAVERRHVEAHRTTENLVRTATTLSARLAEYRDVLITEAVTGLLDIGRSSDSQLDERGEAALKGQPVT